MPRVASEASVVQSHQHHPSSRRPAPAEARDPSTPFAALLDDTPSPPDRDRPERTRRPRADAASGSDARTYDRTRRNNDESKSTAPSDRQQPDAPTDASADETSSAATKTKADDGTANDATANDAKAGDEVESKDTAVNADLAETALDAASTDATAAQQATPDGQVPAPAASVPAVVLPTTTEAVPAVAEGAVAGDAAIEAAAATTAPAQGGGAGKADDLTSDTATGGTRDSDGSKSPEKSPDKSPEPKGLGSQNLASTTLSANKASTSDAKPAPKPHSSGATDASPPAAGHGDAEPASPDASQTGSPAGSPAGSNGAGKSAHATAHTNRAAGLDTADKSIDPATRPEIATAGAADKPVDVFQVTTLPHHAERIGTASAAPAGATTTDPTTTAVPVAGLAVEIASQAQAGRNRFEIRLDPPELGRIDVQLDVHRDGQVTSRLVVEKAETLDLLRRDAPQLERALQQAGLKTGDNGMQFSLRDQGFGGQNQHADDGTRAGAARLLVADAEIAPVDAVQSGYGRSLRLGGGIDIRI